MTQIELTLLSWHSRSITRPQTEIASLAGCRHENITELYGALVYEAQLWIVMEHVGPSMVDILKVLKRIPEDSVAVMAHEGLFSALHCQPRLTYTPLVLMGLSYLHGHQQLHLDIKPSNILLSTGGDCKLCDLGVSISLLKDPADAAPRPPEPHPWLPCVSSLQ